LTIEIRRLPPLDSIFIRFRARSNLSYTVQFQAEAGAAWQTLIDLPAAPANRVIEIDWAGAGKVLNGSTVC
jgi:hypothetical protein